MSDESALRGAQAVNRCERCGSTGHPTWACAKPAAAVPMSGDESALREAVIEVIAEMDSVPHDWQGWDRAAAEILALPELLALRAVADAAEALVRLGEGRYSLTLSEATRHASEADHLFANLRAAVAALDTLERPE